MDKKKIIIIVVALIVALACYLLFKGKGTSKDDSSTSDSDSSNSEDEEDINIPVKQFISDGAGEKGDTLYCDDTVGTVTIYKDNAGNSKVKTRIEGEGVREIGTIDKTTGSYVRLGLNKWVRRSDWAGHLYIRK